MNEERQSDCHGLLFEEFNEIEAESKEEEEEAFDDKIVRHIEITNDFVGTTTSQSASTPWRMRSTMKGPVGRYNPEINSMFRIKDFTRPRATKEDSVIYMRKFGIALAHTHRRDRDRLDEKLYKGTSCQTLVLEIIPSCRRIRRLLEEVLVVDRGFSVGETVIKYENEYTGDPNKDYLCMPKHNQMIGQVLDVRTRGDVLVVPSKQLVVKDVQLGGNDYIELINFNSAHNYIMYKDWIGDAKHCINDVTLLYKDKYRVAVKEGGSCGVLINRRDNSDESKALVPGEVVAITLSELIGRSAEWEHSIPESLQRKLKNHCSDLIRCTIEKVETCSLDVDWVTSPCSLTPPEKTILKNELNNVVRIDISANARVNTCDRLKIKPDDGSKVVTRKEYYAELTDKYRDKFEKMDNAKTIAKERGISFVNDCKVLHNSSGKSDSGPSSPKTAKLSFINECPNEQEIKEYGNIDAVSIPSTDIGQRNSSNELVSGESEIDDDDLIKPMKVSVSRHSLRQKRARKAPLRRRRRVSSLPSGCSRSAKTLLGEEFVGEVLMTRTLVDVEWMDGTIEKNIPGYMLIPHDPDLDQQDHLPGTIVTRKESNNTENVFGMIKSTNCAERSCIVSWFERIPSDKKDSKLLPGAIFRGDEDCTLFDIMAHPLYSRSYIGNFGVYVEKSSHDLKDVAYQVVADLKNGKQRVRYCNGIEKELWPFEMVPIPFGDDDNIDSEEDESTENTSFSMDQDGLSIESSVESSIHDDTKVNATVKFGIWIPGSHSKEELVNANSCSIPALADLSTVRIMMDNIMQEVCDSNKKKISCKMYTSHIAGPSDDVEGRVLRQIIDPEKDEIDPLHGKCNDFASVMNLISSTELLRSQFTVDQFRILVRDYRAGCVHHDALASLDQEKLISDLEQALVCLDEHPKWLETHQLLRQSFLKEIGRQSSIAKKFSPRHLSNEYVMEMLDMARDLHYGLDCFDNFKVERQKSVFDQTYSVINQDNTLPKLSQPHITFIHRQQNSDLPALNGRLLEMSIHIQTIDSRSWPENIIIYFDDRKNHTQIVQSYVELLHVLSRLGLFDFNHISKSSLWQNLDSVFNDSFESPIGICKVDLREAVIFIRSVDLLYPDWLRRIATLQFYYPMDTIFSLGSGCNTLLDEAFDSKFMRCDAGYERESGKGEENGTFQLLDVCSLLHYCVDNFTPDRKFFRAMYNEHKLLIEHVPPGIHVHAFSDRLDILSILITGPMGTPFDSAPFHFVFKMPSDYPQRPPEVTYVAYSQEQLNPNLYQTGKVCTSLLGTWAGEGTETWNPMSSNLLQVLLSIQGLILVSEPYFNEAGYESRKQMPEMRDHSKRYNETAAINSLEYLWKIYRDPPVDFKEYIKKYVEDVWPRLRLRVSGWSEDSPPVFPAVNSKGFKAALKKAIERIDTALGFESSAGM